MTRRAALISSPSHAGRTSVAGLVGALASIAGCSETRERDVVGTQSLAITLVSPSDPGAPDRRLPDGQTTITVDVEAKDADGALDTSFTATVQVFAQFLGTLTPAFGSEPLASLQVANGRANGQTIDLPAVFGPTVLWIDDGSGRGPDYVFGTVTGTSDTLWFRDPYLADVQTPRDETAIDALAVSPLENKQIRISGSRYGERGRLVVTSVFAQGYTVSDVECANADGDPPCTTQAYDHAMVFTFSAPRDQSFGAIELGQVIAGFTGGVAEFNGLTEIGFPQTFAPVDDSGEVVRDVNPARLPPPVIVQPEWFVDDLMDPNGIINFERFEAAPIQVDAAQVCPLDDDFDTFNQWKVVPTAAGTCGDAGKTINVITTGITGVDPAALVGTTLTRIVGVLRPVLTSRGPVWIIYPRSADDIVL